MGSRQRRDGKRQRSATKRKPAQKNWIQGRAETGREKMQYAQENPDTVASSGGQRLSSRQKKESGGNGKKKLDLSGAYEGGGES